jgi:hypothetical protein
MQGILRGIKETAVTAKYSFMIQARLERAPPCVLLMALNVALNSQVWQVRAVLRWAFVDDTRILDLARRGHLPGVNQGHV